jgi:hypothetical protein
MYRSIVAIALMCAGLALTGCGGTTSAAVPEEEPPAIVEAVAGQGSLNRITLTERAAERLGIETVEIAVVPGAAGRTEIPYSAVIYDADGGEWAYVVDRASLVFVRHAITIEDIVARQAGDVAVLSQGPKAGTSVVSVGVAELYGAEFAVGH